MITTTVVGVIAVGAVGYCARKIVLDPVVSKITAVAYRAQQYMHGYQIRTDAVIGSCCMAAIGGHFMPGLSSPYISLGVTGATAGAIYLFNTKIGSMRPLPPGPGQPLMIDPASSHHINADNITIPLRPTGMVMDSVTAAARALSLTDTSAYDFRNSIEKHTAEEVTGWLAANRGRHDLHFKDHFNWAENVKQLLNHKYGIGVAHEQLTANQQRNRYKLLESMGPDKGNPIPLRHPTVEGIPLTEKQLTGWLTDIRADLYAESLALSTTHHQ